MMKYLISSIFNWTSKASIALILTGAIFCTQSCSNLKRFQDSDLDSAFTSESISVDLEQALVLEEHATDLGDSPPMDLPGSLESSLNTGFANHSFNIVEANYVYASAFPKQAETTYQLTVKTSNRKNSGTDARIYAQLIGSAGSSAERRLDKVGHNDFERSSQAAYFITANQDLGEIQKIIIRHDNYGKKPGWHLENVVVVNTKTTQAWNFPCSRWFARTADDGRTRRTLFVNSGCD